MRSVQIFMAMTTKGGDYVLLRKKIDELNEAFDSDPRKVEELLPDFEDLNFELLMMPQLKNQDELTLVAEGKPVSFGVIKGRLATDQDSAQQMLTSGSDVILYREKFEASDANLFSKVVGLLSSREDATSHLSIVARSLGKPMLTNILSSDSNAGLLSKDSLIRPGDEVTIVSTPLKANGEVYFGASVIEHLEIPESFFSLLNHLREYSRLDVGGYADSPDEAQQAVRFGAKHLWPRVEAMFFDCDRLKVLRRLFIASVTGHEWSKAATEAEDILTQELGDLFITSKDCPLKIRLLDPPIHEFLPKNPIEINELCDASRLSKGEITDWIETSSEDNPMLGHRGVRLMVTTPELAMVQLRAIKRAALVANSVLNQPVRINILLPMTVDRKEIQFIREMANEVFSDMCGGYNLGTMIETPRAVLKSNDLAQVVDFFSLGTNDLTAFTFGFSRGDVMEKFLYQYLEEEILEDNPFVSIDSAVAELIQMTVDRARAINPNLSIDLCGEQSHDARTIEFCARAGISSISCSPNRIPVALLIAAKVEIKLRDKTHDI